METYDLIIKNAKIVDGTGGPWFRGDICVKGKSIVSVGKCKDDTYATNVIDARDKVLAPGFIDIHCHYDLSLFRDPVVLTALRQGVTTCVISHCGTSPAPIKKEKVDLIDKYTGFIKAGTEVKWNWQSLGDYLDILEKQKLGINIAAFVGLGTIRLNVMGYDNRRPTVEELTEMKYLIEESMNEGAFGITTGLVYPPGVYTEPEEIIAAAKAVKKYNGLYLSHMRSETDRLTEAVKELIDVAEKNEIPGQIGHLKAGGKKNWGIAGKVLQLLEKARQRGVDITVDQYPYNSASTTLRAILPPWAQTGGVEELLKRIQDPVIRRRISHEISSNEEYENFYIHSGGAEGITLAYTPETPEYEGKSLAETADLAGKDPIEAALDIIIANKGKDLACYFMMDDEDVKNIMKHPTVMIGSDSIPSSPGAKGHPRTCGTFPRVLGKYVRQENALRLEEAVRKMTGFPAGRLNLPKKGLIKAGMDADLVVFDPDTVIDKSDYLNPFREPEGIDYVIVNGKIVIEKGGFTGARVGRVIKRA